MGLQHALETGERFTLRTPQIRARVIARNLGRARQLERVAIENQVGAAAIFRSERRQKPIEVFGPPEVLVRRPRAIDVASFTQMEIGEHHDSTRSAVPWLGADRADRDDEAHDTDASQPGHTTAPAHRYGSMASESRTTSLSLRTTM